MRSYFEWVAERESLLCVGLDPTPEQLSMDFLRRIIETTADLVGAFKPNSAFFEAGGMKGRELLRRVICLAHIHDVPVILDAKKEDIGNTASAYARAVFDDLGADAVTVGPYLGSDSVGAFTNYPGKGVYVLCHTSNPSAKELQHQMTAGQPLYLHVAELAGVWNKNGNVGLVVGATFPEEISRVRAIAPRLPFLIPGIGAQGGDLEKSVRAGLIRDIEGGVLINVSRGVANAPDCCIAAQKFRDDLEAARAAVMSQPEPVQGPNDELVLALFDAGCIKFGDFVLHSGSHSPIYLDLRMLVSRPDVMWLVARAYAKLLAGLSFSRLAAIPYAALPIGSAVSLLGGWPMIYPREPKGHGTKVSIEGAYIQEETVVVLDDLITTGASKLEAIAPLLEAGLRVVDIVVLIDREQGGREQLVSAGYCLHSLLTLRQVVDTLWSLGKIDLHRRQEVFGYLQQQVR